MCYPTCSEIQYYLETTLLPIRRDVDLWENRTSGLHEVWYNEILRLFVRTSCQRKSVRRIHINHWFVRTNENISIIQLYFGSNCANSRARRQLYSLHQIVGESIVFLKD